MLWYLYKKAYGLFSVCFVMRLAADIKFGMSQENKKRPTPYGFGRFVTQKLRAADCGPRILFMIIITSFVRKCKSLFHSSCPNVNVTLSPNSLNGL